MNELYAGSSIYQNFTFSSCSSSSPLLLLLFSKLFNLLSRTVTSNLLSFFIPLLVPYIGVLFCHRSIVIPVLPCFLIPYIVEAHIFIAKNRKMRHTLQQNHTSICKSACLLFAEVMEEILVNVFCHISSTTGDQ